MTATLRDREKQLALSPRRADAEALLARLVDEHAATPAGKRILDELHGAFADHAVPARGPRLEGAALGSPQAQGLRDVIAALAARPGGHGLIRATLSEATRATRAPLRSLTTRPSPPDPSGQALWRAAERRAATLYRRAAEGDAQPDDPAVEEALHRIGSGRALPEAVRAVMERALGVPLGRVRVHTDAVAAEAARTVRAEAFTVGEDIFFAGGAFEPHTEHGAKLLAHELAHVVQGWQGRTATGGAGVRVSEPGDALEGEAEAVAERLGGGARPAAQPAVQPAAPASTGSLLISRKKDPKAKKPSVRDQLPWIGRIAFTELAALRGKPKKDPADPHKHTLADLPRGTFVTVFETQGGWLHVKVTVEGKAMEGWISQELVLYDRPTDMDDVRDMPSFRKSLLILKRAQTRKQQGTKPSKSEEEETAKAVEIVKRDKKYKVDEATFEVTFAASDKKLQVTSIEDFVLFVEDVERQYPSAAPATIATEVRQLWFSDSNWDVLVDGDGIMEQGRAVDIETEPNPIAKRYDMADLAPTADGKRFATRLGTVDIGHVMAGIDAALNGGPKAYPKERLKRRGADNGTSRFKHEKLNELDDNNPRAFTTWAGDLGQAYAAFISDVYVDHKPGELWQYISEYASPEEILGDIHGYIAVQVWKDTPAGDDPTGAKLEVSSVLRDLYMLDAPGGTKDDGTYRAKFEKVSGKVGTELRQHIWNEAFAFAEPWFAKLVIDNHMAAGLDGYDELVREFNVLAGQHEDSAERENTLQGRVDKLIAQLDDKVR